MLSAPPPDSPPLPPPPITRPMNSEGVSGLTAPDFAPSNQLIAEQQPFLRSYFANKHIDRPANLTLNGAPNLGSYGNGNVRVDRSTDDPWIAQHELLHALSTEHPLYNDEQYTGFARLSQAIRDSGPLQEQVQPWANPRDMAHTFVNLGLYAMYKPDLLPPALQNYFAPLLPPVRPVHGNR